MPNGKTYKAKLLSELTLREYEKVLELMKFESEVGVIGILHILTGISEIELKLVDLASFNKIDFNKLLVQEYKDREDLPKLKYDYLSDFNKLNFGKFVEIEVFLQLPEPIGSVLSILFSEIEHDMDDLDKIKFDILDTISMGDALKIFNTYVEWRANKFEDYGALFNIPPKKVEDDDEDEDEDGEDIFDVDEEDEDEEEEENKGIDTSWVDIAYQMAETPFKVKEVFDFEMGFVFSWLQYKYETAEKEREALA